MSDDKNSDSLQPEEIRSAGTPYQLTAGYELTERLHLLLWDLSP
jgi:hypothetical protein